MVGSQRNTLFKPIGSVTSDHGIEHGSAGPRCAYLMVLRWQPSSASPNINLTKPRGLSFRRHGFSGGGGKGKAMTQLPLIYGIGSSPPDKPSIATAPPFVAEAQIDEGSTILQVSFEGAKKLHDALGSYLEKYRPGR